MESTSGEMIPKGRDKPLGTGCGFVPLSTGRGPRRAAITIVIGLLALGTGVTLIGVAMGITLLRAVFGAFG